MQIIKNSQQIEHQCQQYEAQRHPLGHFGKLGVQGLGFALGHKGVRADGDGAGETRAFAGLEQDHGDKEEAGQKLDDGKDDGERVHKIQPFLYCKKIRRKRMTT